MAKKKTRTTKKPKASDKQSEGQTPAGQQPSSDTESSTKETFDFPIVGIGASAGGLEALETLFQHMPSHTGMVFVGVTHQHPDHVRMLPEVLSRNTTTPVMEARDGSEWSRITSTLARRAAIWPS